MSLTDRQGDAGRQGREYERAVVTALKIAGYQIDFVRWRHPLVLVEVDIVASRADVGAVWIECKGSWLSTRNGLQRTDTLAKALGKAYVLRSLPDRQPYWLVSSHLPRAHSAGERWLIAAGELFDRVVQHPGEAL